MTTTTATTRPRAARIALLVTGALSALIAVGLLAGSGLALLADSQKDADGYHSTGTERFATETHALASDNLDVDLDGAESILDDGALGTARLQVTSRNGEPVFAGVARTSDVASYLRGVAHTTVTDVDFDPFEADYSAVEGERRPGSPAQERFWTESVQGAGTQTLTWDVEDGDWSVVVMNADGSSGVQADVKAAAKVPLLNKIGWVGTAVGTVLLLVAAGLLTLGIRSPRRPSGAAG